MARSRRGGAAASSDGEAASSVSEADRIIDAALARIPIEGWRQLSLASIAVAAGLPILRVYRNFHSKQAILCAFLRRIDEAQQQHVGSAFVVGVMKKFGDDNVR